MVQVQRPLDVTNIQFHVPAMTVQLRNLRRRILVRIDKSRYHRDTLAPASSRNKRIADHAKLQRLRNRRVLLLAHPRRTLRTLPRHQTVVLAETLSASKINAAFRIDSRTNIDASPSEQREHHVRTTVTVEHGNVARIERVEHLTQQRGFAGLLAFVFRERRVENHGRCERQHDADTHDRKAATGLLSVLRKFPLIVVRVRHGRRESIDELGVMLVFPEPIGGRDGLGIFCDKKSEFVKGVEGKPFPCVTIIAGIGGRRLVSERNEKRGDAADGGGAGSGLSVGEDLGEKGPEDDGGVVKGSALQGVIFSKRPFDGFGGQDAGEGERRIVEKVSMKLFEGVLAERRFEWDTVHKRPPWHRYETKTKEERIVIDPRRTDQDQSPRTPCFYQKNMPRQEGHAPVKFFCSIQ